MTSKLSRASIPSSIEKWFETANKATQENRYVVPQGTHQFVAIRRP
jgi:hypothetical protein